MWWQKFKLSANIQSQYGYGGNIKLLPNNNNIIKIITFKLVEGGGGGGGDDDKEEERIVKRAPCQLTIIYENAFAWFWICFPFSFFVLQSRISVYAVGSWNRLTDSSHLVFWDSVVLILLFGWTGGRLKLWSVRECTIFASWKERSILIWIMFTFYPVVSSTVQSDIIIFPCFPC